MLARLGRAAIIASTALACRDAHFEAVPPTPAAIAAAESLPDVPDSRLELPVRYDLAPALAWLEGEVPRTIGTIESKLPVPGNDRAHFAFQIERERFRLAFGGGGAALSAVLHYQGRGWYNPPVLPEVSASCGTGARAMAALNALILASAITISRKSGADMGLVPLVTAIIPGLAALIMLPGGALQIEQPAFILFNGLVMIPLAFFCLATGPRYLSAPEVGMFYLLETILAPIWVWVIFTERRSNQTLIGGSILIVALLVHSLWQMRSKARAARRRAGGPEIAATQA